MEVITTLNHKWKAMALVSLAFFMVIFSVVSDRTENSIFLGGIAIAGITVTGYIYFVGPRLEKQGLSIMKMPLLLPALNRFLGETVQTFSFKTDELKIVQDDGATTRFYLLEGPPIGKFQMLDLIKYLSGIDTTVVYMEVPVWMSKTMREHAEDLKERMLKSDNQKQRMAIARSYKGKLKEFDDPSMAALIAVTTKGENTPLVAYGNVKFVLIPPEEYFGFLEGEATEGKFKYRLAKKYPVLKHRVAKVFTGIEYVPTDNIGDILDICRRQFAGIQFVTRLYDQITALRILADERDRISIKIRNLDTPKKQASGENQRLLKEEEERLELVEDMESIIKKGEDSLYAVIPRLFCTANNLKALEKRGEKLTKELEIKGLKFSEPLEQTSFFEKVLSCKDVGKEHSLSILESDLSEILPPLFRTSQQCINPKGIFFGTTNNDEPVLLDITELPSEGIGGVIAKTGIGKSYFLNLLGHEMFLKITWNLFIMNPKGRQQGDLRFDGLVEYLGGASLKIKSINIFDMFLDGKLQLAYERQGLSILCKGIDLDLAEMIVQKAGEIRASGQTPTFELLYEQFKKEISVDVETSQSMIPSLSSDEYSKKIPLAQILKHISPLARDSAFSNTPASFKRLPSCIEVDFSDVFGFSKAALINLTLNMLCLMKGKPTFILADEIHEIIALNPNLGTPNSSELVMFLSTQGRAMKKIPVISAQSLKFFAPENTMTDAEKVANVAFEQISWLLLLGEQQKETLARLNLLAYEEYFKREKIGKGLLVVSGYPKPIEVNVKVPAYLHEIFTGKKRPLQLSNKEELPDVLRIDQLDGSVVKELIDREGYVRLEHKELNGADQIFLVPWADDPRRMEDICLCKEFFEKQGLETEVDWEIGIMRLPWGMLFVQSYEYPHQVTHLTEWLDRQSENWFVVCHKPYQEIKDGPLAKKFVMRNEVSAKFKFVV